MFDKIIKAIKATHRAAANAVGTATGVETSCYRCNDKLSWKSPHYTEYAPGLGCSPLCQECWAKLKPIERMPFYYAFVGKTFVGDYISVRDIILLQVRQSVMDGK